MEGHILLPPALNDVLAAEHIAPQPFICEATAVALYRMGKLSRPQFGSVLGLDRFQVDAVLKRHQVTEDLLTVDEFDLQLKSINRVLPLADRG